MSASPRRQASSRRGSAHASHVWASPRLLVLSAVARRATHARWTSALLTALLEELHVDETFEALVGVPDRLDPSRAAEALTVALALRHSWREDDLSALIAHLDRHATTTQPRKPHRRPRR